MKKAKHILRVTAKLAVVVAALAALGFVEQSGDSVPVRDIQVQLQGNGEMRFIDADALREEVASGAGAVIGTPMNKVDEAGIEQRLRSIPSVASADVYHTMDGVLHVRASQREPIVRVVNADGTGFYIDKEGWTMPLDPNYTARVLVVTGQLAEPFDKCAPVNVAYGNDSLAARFHSRAIHAMATTLRADPAWNALFTQAVMDAAGDITLIPSVGMMQVRVGDGGRLEQRLQKLATFYRQGIPQADWRRYSIVDLRFDDQVVCTKRNS